MTALSLAARRSPLASRTVRCGARAACACCVWSAECGVAPNPINATVAKELNQAMRVGLHRVRIREQKGKNRRTAGFTHIVSIARKAPQQVAESSLNPNGRDALKAELCKLEKLLCSIQE
ncbi:hypothetical protein PAAG_02072 [Paracoccidioides lutzii Pb01]|uniref:Uncharacterized protein n=1 Tax=Paracoccidioides lutzii (strain ATCC MYA-826 / Pb01) TaxID=502779 RepID=C1GU77_PARBA|nr:hypothetical protein PAAG_02072 [Paracoccidioides lutzii Pb01]EEH39883.2 hypothetical protein PAAG_02072 [Paracoccidioides lutzii Pb01]